MSVEDALRTTLQESADSLPPSWPDVGALVARGRADKRRRDQRAFGMFAAAAVLVVGVLGGLRWGSPTDDVAPAEPSDPVQYPTWTAYPSQRYGFEISVPSNWSAEASSRAWSPEVDGGDSRSVGQERFSSPLGDVGVSAWSTPLPRAERIRSKADLVAWATDYCETTGNEPCAGIGERAVDLCIERMDCHPAILVQFNNDVQAFLSGGIYDTKKMTIVAVWRPEWYPSVSTYGGAQNLLEAILSTMQVWPAAAIVEDRYLRPVPVETLP